MGKKNKCTFLLTTLFAIFILLLSVIPTDISGSASPFYFRGMDKLIHGMMYGLFTMLSLYEYFRQKPLILSSLYSNNARCFVIFSTYGDPSTLPGNI